MHDGHVSWLAGGPESAWLCKALSPDLVSQQAAHESVLKLSPHTPTPNLPNLSDTGWGEGGCHV